MSEKHFLAYRDKDGLRKVEIFEAEEQEGALATYAEAEVKIMLANLEGGPLTPYEVCLFGADSLATLCKTHASWFAPETLDLQSLVHGEEKGNG